MKNRSRFLIALWLLLSGIACAQKDSEQAQFPIDREDQVGVIGGMNVEPQSALAYQVIGLYDRKSRSVCTGTLIAPDMVLTAAHCVNPKSQELEIIFATHFAGAGWPDSSRILRAHSFQRHPNYNPKRSSGLETFDLALVHFKGRAPAPYEAVPLNSDSLDGLSKGNLFTAAGFGLSNPYFRMGAGRLRTAQIPFEKMHSKTEIQTKQGTSGVCFGDSGGPLFQKSEGRWIQIGVASRVAPRTLFCRNYAVYTRVDLYLDWIHQASAELRNQN